MSARRPADTGLAGESPVEALYREAREAVVAGRGPASMAAPDRPFRVDPGIEAVPLRTPTLPPATHTNSYLVGSGEVVVVDPPSPYTAEREALDAALDARRAAGHQVVAIWLTHHHADHVGGAAHLARRLGVPVAAHAETAARLGARVPVDAHLHDDQVLALAGDPPRRLRAIFTPGHAPGHLCFYEEETGCLLAGDMVAGIGTILVEPSEGDMRRYLDSLARLERLAPARLLPAHGPIIDDAVGRLRAYVAHRLWREARVLEALQRRGRSAAGELVPEAYADAAPAVYPLAERSLEAHLIKLCADGRVRREGHLWVAVPGGAAVL
jgi:endoribonuclease LACTB2